MRPSKINGPINKAGCCVFLPSLGWLSVCMYLGVCVSACVCVCTCSCMPMPTQAIACPWRQSSFTQSQANHSSSCTSKSAANREQSELVQRQSTLLGLLLLNTSCLLQSVWSCLHYWYSRGLRGPGSDGAQAHNVLLCVWRETGSCESSEVS